MELLVNEPGTESFLPLREYLRRRRAGEVDWAPDLVLLSLGLDAGGRTVWEPPRPIGDLGRVVLQFEAAAERLANDEPAIVRQAVEDSDWAVLLLLDPAAEERVTASVRFLHGTPEAVMYPVSEHYGQELYAFVAAHRDELETASGGAWDDMIGPPAPLERAFAVERLREEAAVGRQTAAALGQDLAAEF